VSIQSTVVKDPMTGVIAGEKHTSANILDRPTSMPLATLMVEG
jgi:hypothetical protein